MILITGGSYQGKLQYARERFHLTDADICFGGVDFTKRCLAYIERWALECVKSGTEPKDFFMKDSAAWRDRIIIVTDISGGVVPMDATLRAWREASGRLNSALAAEADEVWRLFCGIPQRLK